MNNTSEKNKLVFISLIKQYETACLINLGIIKDPLTNKFEKNPTAAQFIIDTLEMLKIKTRGNLEADEEKYVDSIISQLKLTYVKEMDKIEEKESAQNTPEESKGDKK